MNIVISQPMYFPWIGFISQLAMADVIIWLDDVEFSRGSFTNRVQLKSGTQSSWLTIPLCKKGKSQLIYDLQSAEPEIHDKHYSKLSHALSGCPYKRDAMSIFEETWKTKQSLSHIIIRSTELLLDKFLKNRPHTYLSSSLDICGTGSHRVLNLVKYFGGTTYITGHGAKNYLDHDAFASAGIIVEYMDYGPFFWPQKYGGFTPFVSSLDLIANVGSAQCNKHLVCRTLSWQQFITQ